MDIQEDGTVFIAGVGGACDAAAERIKAIVKVPEVGESTPVASWASSPSAPLSSCCPARTACSTSPASPRGRVDKVEDVLNIGDEVKVRVLEVDEKGKISLDRIDKPRPRPAPTAAPTRAAEKDRPRREHRAPRRRPGDNGGEDRPRPRRHHGA